MAPQNLAKTLELTYAELRRLRDAAVSEEELDANREQIKGHMLMSLESTFARMARMAKSMMYYGRLVTVEEVLEKVDAVTVEDIQAFARETFAPGRCAVFVLGPAGGCAIEGIAL